jgi:hypothetical protein
VTSSVMRGLNSRAGSAVGSVILWGRAAMQVGMAHATHSTCMVYGAYAVMDDHLVGASN